MFVSQLEVLNIPYTVQSFLSTPKEGLVKGLWKNHSHEPQVTSSMAPLLELLATADQWHSPVFTGSTAGGGSMPGISGVRPQTVEQSASKAAGLQLSEQNTFKNIWKNI